MKAIFIRHGRTNYNVKDLCNDDKTKDVHLTELGKRQAETAAKKLKNEKFGIIFVSELPRTMQTAKIINKYHNVPIKVDKRINDRKTGFEGKSASLYYNAIKKDPNFKKKGGESLKEEKKRVLSFFKNLKKMKYRSVLIVTHKEIIQIIEAHLKKMNDEELYMIPVKNCEIREFEI